MNSNNLIIKKPKEKNDLIFIIKKCLLEILKFTKKIAKENSYDLSCNKGLDGIDFRKNWLSQIMNKIAFVINNNIENSNNKHIIFYTNYLYLNIDKLPNQYKEKNYRLLFDELIGETQMKIDKLESNLIIEYHCKLKATENNNRIIKHYASQMKKLKEFKCIEYLYNKVMISNKFIITKDSKNNISNIKYESNEKTSKENIKNMIEGFPDFNDYEDKCESILDIEEKAKTPEALADYFDTLRGLIKEEKIFKEFSNEEKQNIILELKNYIDLKLYDKLFPFNETTQDIFFYRK